MAIIVGLPTDLKIAISNNDHPPPHFRVRRGGKDVAQVSAPEVGMIIARPEPARDDSNPEIEIDADGMRHMAEGQRARAAAE